MWGILRSGIPVSTNALVNTVHMYLRMQVIDLVVNYLNGISINSSNNCHKVIHLLVLMLKRSTGYAFVNHNLINKL